MSWNIPKLEAVSEFTDKALNIMNSRSPEEILEKLSDSNSLGIEANTSYFSQINSINTLKNEVKEALETSDMQAVETSMKKLAKVFTNLLDGKKELKSTAKNLFEIGTKKLINIATNYNQEALNKQNPIDKAMSVSNMSKNQKIGVEKMKQTLDNLEIVKETSFDITVKNVLRDIYDELKDTVQDKEGFKASLENINNITQSIIDLKTTLEKSNFGKEGLNKALNIRDNELKLEIQNFVNLATNGEEEVSEQLANRVEELIKIETDVTTKFLQEELSKQNTPEYQTDSQVLAKYGEFSNLAEQLMLKGRPTVLNISMANNKGETLLKNIRFNTDNAKVSSHEDVQIGDFLIPIPHAEMLNTGIIQQNAEDPNSGYKVEVNKGGFMKISNSEGHTTHMVTPLGVEMQFSESGTPHPKSLADLKIKSSFLNKGNATGHTYGKKIKAKLEAFQRKNGGGLSKSKAKSLTPINRIVNRYGGVDELDNSGKYTYTVNTNGKLTAFTDSPERTTATNVTAPRQVLFGS